ncbi:MAG TPA: hypothetical protein GXZ90_09455 [Clostridiales bacterium]|nr:hypothetical protein [Clostridiales bacterium]
MSKVDNIQSINNNNDAIKTNRKGNSDLGKEAFLQLLVAQLKYQDPLNPSSDTEFVSQLANFSQLEQLQNLSKVTTNSQAFGLVGKTVIVKSEDSAGKIEHKKGVIDFINISGGKAQVSIEEQLYDLEQITSVIDEFYLLQQGLPGVEHPNNLRFYHDDPKDISFEVNMGSGETIADDVAIILGEKVLNEKMVKVVGNTITIDKEALKNIPSGDYKITIAFNDPLYTMVRDKITVNISGEAIIEEEQQEPEE